MALETQINQLSELIDEINKPLSSLDRKKLIMLCTIDVHARDVVGRLIEERVEDGMCFQWQSQLRYQTNEKTKSCQVNICDAEIQVRAFASPRPLTLYFLPLPLFSV